jgi:ABC-type maltose transport system permease subunit
MQPWRFSRSRTPGTTFLAPLIFLLDQALYTFRLGLSLFRGAYDVQRAYLMASSLVVTLPVIVMFFYPALIHRRRGVHGYQNINSHAPF